MAELTVYQGVEPPERLDINFLEFTQSDSHVDVEITTTYQKTRQRIENAVLTWNRKHDMPVKIRTRTIDGKFIRVWKR